MKFIDTPREVTFQLPQLKLAAKVYGDDQLPKILLLHGWLDNCASFDALAPYLAEYQLVALDWPGHGLSEHRAPGARVHFLDQVDDLVLLLQQQSPFAAVVGHSMGGAVAALAAGAFPELFTKLIFLDMLGPLSAESGHAASMLRRAIKLGQKESRRQVRQFDSFEQALQRRAMVSTLDAELLKPIVQRNLAQIDGNYQWCTDPRLKLPSAYRMTEEQVLAVLQSIKADCYLIASETLFEREPEKMQLRRNSVPNLKVDILNADHHLHIEQPERVALLIRQFLSS